MNFRENFEWQFRFLEPISKILGPRLLQPAAIEIDMKEATDMLLLLARDMKIACRVRRPGFMHFRWQFTIRSSLPSGAKTELQKIDEGFGDWMFYGHAAQSDEPILTHWHIIDLHAFRAHLIRNPWFRPKQILNGDGTKFVAFDVREFSPDPPILIDSNVTQALEPAV